MIDFVKNKILKKKNTVFLVIFTCFVLALLAGVGIVGAQTADTSDVISGTVGLAVATLIGWITSIISMIIGLILTALIKILVNVAEFNNIINVDAVKVGWVIVRDLVNMFFVLILLVIAFATILRIESYNAKRTLPKLLIMAVLINFSKTVFGIIIDFSQVIMLTFVNGFGRVGAANLISLFNIQNYQSIKTLGDEKISNFSVAGAFIAGLLAMIITLIVVSVILGVLIMRVVLLWIYTILSPLVFLGFAFPPIQKYVGRIWDDFIKQVVIGPLLAFFIWLALITVDKSSKALGTFTQTNETCAGINAFFCEGNLQTYIITIGLLIGGLMVTQQIGGAAGSMAGKGMVWARNVGGFAPALAGKGAKTGLFAAGRGLDTLQMKAQKKIFGKTDENFRPKSLNYRMIAEGWKARKAEKMREYESGLSGAWHDRFDRAMTLQGGTKGEKIKSLIPGIAAKQRADARKKIKEAQMSLTKSDDAVGALQAQLEQETDQGKREELEKKIQAHKDNIKKQKRVIATQKMKLPDNRRAKYDKNARVYEHFNEITKYNLTEDELVQAYMQEQNKDKKKAYFQHLVDINGVNTLFSTMGKDYDFKGIQKFLKDEFKEDAGDVAEEMSKRAEAAGNYKLIGHGRLNLATGKNELIAQKAFEVPEDKMEEAFENAYKIKRSTEKAKRKERFSQGFARTTHNDTLVDIMDDGSTKLSLGGIDTAIDIARDKGKFAEIKKGNYQTRFAKVFADMNDAQVQDVINEARLGAEEAKEFRKVVDEFKEYYASGGEAKRKTEEAGEAAETELSKLKEELKTAKSGIKASQLHNKINELEEKSKKEA